MPYLCGQEECVRTFANPDSWSRHLVKQHGYKLSKQVDSWPSHSSMEPLSDTAGTSASELFDEFNAPVEDDGSCNEDRVSLEDLKQEIFNSGVHLVSALRSDSSVTIKTCEIAVRAANDLVEAVVGYISALVEDEIHSFAPEHDVSGLCEKFNSLVRPLDFLATKQKQDSYFHGQQHFVSPIQYEFRRRQETQYVPGGVPTLRGVKDVWQYVPLEKTLQALLSHSYIFEHICARKPRTDGVLEDIIDGSVCRSNALMQDESKLTIALDLYYDDIEIVNPLGPHKGLHKMGVFYVSVRNLPPYFNSSMANIYLIALAKTQDLSIYGNAPVLDRITEEIRELETKGFQFECNGRIETAFATLLVVNGDNLGQHQILGFREGFTAHRFCQYCMITFAQIQTTFKESEVVMRTREMFDQQLREVLDDRTNEAKREYGINSRCPLMDLKYFHVTQNQIGDLLHNILSGIGPYEVKAVLYHLVHVQNLFTLNDINQRIAYFAYGTTDKKNRPIEIDQLRNILDKDRGLGQRGLPFWCLLRLLPLMIGDLVPIGNVYWQFFLDLRQICDLLFAPKWNKSMSEWFRELYPNHMHQFKTLFPNFGLIPKHHLTGHYATFSEATGPPYVNMVANEEMKGKILKNRLEVKLASETVVDTLPIFEAIIDEFPNRTSVQLLKKFSVRGQEYREGNVLPLFRSEESGIPIFGTLVGAISNDLTPNNLRLLVKLLTTESFDCHYWCYCVTKTSETYKWLPFELLMDWKPLDMHNSDNCNVYRVCPRYHIC